MKPLVVAIDGPASAGKSTVAKQIAKDFNYIYVDTGAMYRCATLLAERNHLAFNDGKAIVEALKNGSLTFRQEVDGQHVYFDHEDITLAIRMPEINAHVSEVAALEEVRHYLVSLQQAYGEKGGLVMDGRDIGTCVFPNADVKIFLVASVEERAERRHKENLEKGIPSNLEQLKEEIARRDHLDETREISPLTKAKDAILVDTTGMSIEEVVAKIEGIMKEKEE